MTDSKHEFRENLKHFDTAMLVTRSTDGTVRARPMSIAAAEEDGDLWFATSVGSGKVDEIWQDQRVAATLQSKERFLSISGHAELVRDRAKIHQLWRDTWKVWFPQGKDDPDLALIHVVAEEAEYWDQHGAKGLRYAFEAGKSLIQGKRPDPIGQEHHAKIPLGNKHA